MKHQNRKAEITTQQIVVLIILIASFAVIIFFIVKLNLGQTTIKEVCYNSVVTRGSSVLPKESVPLDCKTSYICISGGGECEDISPTSTIEVDPNNKDEIMKAIADEMVDCWWMFGEGKLDYLTDLEKGLKTTCALCSVIEFDDKILQKNYKISYGEFYEYLNKTEKEDTESYFYYLYDSSNIVKFQNEISFLKIDLDDDFILDNAKYSVVTGYRVALEADIEFIKNYYIYSYYVRSDRLVSELDCNEFITRA